MPLRYVEYAAFRDVMDVFVFCFWQRVLGSIQPPTTKNIFVYICYLHLIFSCQASNSDELCYHFAVQEGVSPKKKIQYVRLRGTFFPKNSQQKSSLEKEDWKVISLYFWNLCLCKDHVQLQGYNGSNNPLVKQGRLTKLSSQNHGKPGNFGKVKPPKFNREFTPEK